MSKNRLAAVAGPRAPLVAAPLQSRRVTASAKPARHAATPSSSASSRSSRSTSTSPLVGGAKAWQKAHPNVSVMYAQGKSATDDAGEIAAIQNMVASGVKGIAITPTSAAVIPALNKAVKDGVKVVLMDNDLPTWKSKSSVVATNNLKGGVARRQVARRQAQGRRHPRDPRGRARRPGARRPRQRHAERARRHEVEDQDRLEARDRLRPDQGRRGGADDADRNPHLTAIYSACGPPALGAIQSIKNAGIKPGGIVLVGFDGLPPEVTAIKAGTENASVAQHPDKIGSLGIATLYAAVKGKTVQKNVDTGTSLITAASAK